MRAWSQGTHVGDLIGASFGVVFIVINVSPLAPGWRLGVIVAAAGMALVIAAAFFLTQRIVGLWVGFATHQADAVALVSGVGSGLVLLGVTFATAVRTLVSLRPRDTSRRSRRDEGAIETSHADPQIRPR